MIRKEKKSKTGLILVIFIAGIMVTSVFGVIFFGFGNSQETTRVEYNGFTLSKGAEYWATPINNQEINFRFLPSQLEDINLTQDIINKISNIVEIDTTSALNDTYKEEIALANFELAQELRKLNIYIREGFTTNETARPKITCLDATNAIPVVFFIKSNTTQLTLENNCIIAEANAALDALRIKDRLLYSITGIIK